MNILHPKKLLSTVVSIAVCQSVTTQASDIEIYQNAKPSTITLMMLIDISGSMDYMSYGGGNACDAPNQSVKKYALQKINPHADAPTYRRQWCEVTSGGVTTEYPDRITRVKDGMIDLLFGNTSKGITALPDNNIIGLSTLGWVRNPLLIDPTQSDGRLLWDGTQSSSPMINQTNMNSLAYGKTGTYKSERGGSESDWDNIGNIAVPARRLDATITVDGVSITQRKYLAQKIASLAAVTNTPTARSYAETIAYLLGETTQGRASSGYNFANPDAYDTTRTGYYAAPSSMTQAEADKQCNGQGVYVLTDGDPYQNVNAQGLIQGALGSTGSSFSCSTNDNAAGTWDCVRKLAKNYLLNGNNPKGVAIKTAVVGFGKNFNSVPSYDKNKSIADNVTSINASSASSNQKNAALWGVEGGGGWYSGSSSEDVVNSVKGFLNEIEVEIPAVATGSPTLPQDALNPLRVQPYGYYASFDPKPSQSLWVGNMNKYHVVNGKLVGSDEETSIFKTDGSLNSTVMGLWLNGFKGTLELGANGEKTQFVRNVLTNRVISDSGSEVSEGNSLSNVALGSDYLTTDPKQRYWLNLLGYDVDTSVTTVDPNLAANYITATANLRQVGATMHSTPILLTQSGTIASDLTTTNRKDYLLFGTTQGLLHVVDSKSGKEVFAFAPHEMMERQPKALIEESKAGSGALFYGIDAPWAAYTEYVNNKNGSLTVGQSDYSSTERNKLTGKQWVYGGLRMGGQSYYALDLSNISSPALKFHIDPANQTIHYGAYKDANNNDVAAGEHSNVGALSYMGDSWSKPTLAYVNFGGEKKLVMFVGGGYDEGYEAPDYNPTTATKGTGVYMFDANNGKLLWWTGVNATTKGGAEAYTTSTDMKYSVVSQINAIDRDNDGLVDNLYFGDLGGQAFRVDLNNAATGTGDNAAVKLESQKTNFATRVVLLTSRHAGGASPRFYEMPSFSVHRDSSLGLYGVVALSSGNRSSPLAGVVSTNNPSASTSANDGVFVVFDKDVGRTDLYTLTDSGASALKTKNVTLANLKSTYSTTGVAPTQAGWYYSYGTEDTEAGVYKGMNSIYAVDSILYANVFHRDGKGIGGGCGAGVKGDSYLYRFCLPSGSCSGRFNGADGKPIAEASPQSVALGAGILGSALGGASELKNIAPSTTDCNIAENKNKIECQAFTTAGKIRTLRWYETR